LGPAHPAPCCSTELQILWFWFSDAIIHIFHSFVYMFEGYKTVNKNT